MYAQASRSEAQALLHELAEALARCLRTSNCRPFGSQNYRLPTPAGPSFSGGYLIFFGDQP
jgi:hypothetical protein